MFEILNISLTNDVVSFEQPGPGKVVHLHRTASHLYTLVKSETIFSAKTTLALFTPRSPGSSVG